MSMFFQTLNRFGEACILIFLLILAETLNSLPGIFLGFMLDGPLMTVFIDFGRQKFLFNIFWKNLGF